MGFVDELRAKAIFKIKTKGKLIEDVFISQIPKVWGFFRDKPDRWVNVEYPEDAELSGCLYQGVKGSDFEGHVHKKHDEMGMVLNEDGLIKIYTPEWSKTVKYGESFFIPKGIPHYFDFIETSLISVKWHPPMQGWEGKFINDENS